VTVQVVEQEIKKSDLVISSIGSEKMPYVSGGIITKISSASLPDPGWRICDAVVDRLNPGQEVAVDCSIFQTLPVGSHKFTFLVDDGNRLSETNENNNERSIYLTVSKVGRDDLVSGTLSVDKTTAQTGEDITLTITAQDDNGVAKVAAYYQGSWHTQICEGYHSCTKNWTFPESSTGTKYYYGYVYGKKLNGSSESAYTKPYYVRVVVSSPGVSATCNDSDGGKNYYVKGTANSTVSGVEGRVDCCKLYYSSNLGDAVKHIGPGGGACVDSGPYLYEAICGSDGNPTTVVYQCPNGCQNGACVSATSEAERIKELSSKMASIEVIIANLMESLKKLKK